MSVVSPRLPLCANLNTADSLDKDLWPADARDCEVKNQNFYCLDAWKPKCCWLNPLMGTGDTKEEREPRTRPYFQEMSAAMALTCTGTVYVLHDNPNEIGLQPKPPPEPVSIWLSHEAPILQGLLEDNVITGLKVGETNADGTPKETNFDLWMDKTDWLRSFVPPAGATTVRLRQAVKAAVHAHHARTPLQRNITEHNLLQRGFDPLGTVADFTRKWNSDLENPLADYFG